MTLACPRTDPHDAHEWSASVYRDDGNTYGWRWERTRCLGIAEPERHDDEELLTPRRRGVPDEPVTFGPCPASGGGALWAVHNRRSRS